MYWIKKLLYWFIKYLAVFLAIFYFSYHIAYLESKIEPPPPSQWHTTTGILKYTTFGGIKHKEYLATVYDEKCGCNVVLSCNPAMKVGCDKRYGVPMLENYEGKPITVTWCASPGGAFALEFVLDGKVVRHKEESIKWFGVFKSKSGKYCYYFCGVFFGGIMQFMLYMLIRPSKSRLVEFKPH